MAPQNPRHARVLLATLVVVYVFNFLDRQIVSILAERIKADLGTTDAQMGFLYGTAFAVFYAIFGIPLGRLADLWERRRLIAIGLAFWSVMTGLSGLSSSFAQLAAARIGVGIGEASASPAAFSMLSDAFPAARRATVLAIYSSGIYIGAGLGLGIGGLVVDRWDAAFAGGAAPFGLRGWQVAFLAVGLPGLLLSLAVSRLREPVRGAMDGLAPAAPDPAPFAEFGREIASIVPPLTIGYLGATGAGAGAIGRNLAGAIAAAGFAWAMTAWLGTPLQWVALATGLYAAGSWAQSLRRRDPATHALVFATPSLRAATLGFSFLAFTGYGTGFWLAPFLMRVHGASATEVGLTTGGLSAVGGWLGVTAGGLLADRLRRRTRNGRLLVGLLCAVAPLPVAALLFTTPDTRLALALVLPLTTATSLWLGPGASTVQDLVLPRMRATASAAYLLSVTFVGLAMGPYVIGRLSSGLGDLRRAILWGLVANAIAAGCLLRAMRDLPRDEALVAERARRFEAGAGAAGAGWG